MTALTGILLAIIGGAIAVKKAGLYAAWATFLNIVFSIYLAVHLVPVTVKLVPALQDNPLGPVIWTAGMMFLVFGLLQILYSVLLSEFRVTLPKIIDSLGALAVGALTAVVLWGFACMLLLISPIAEANILEDIYPKTELKSMSTNAVGTTVRVIGILSLDKSADFEHLVERLRKLDTEPLEQPRAN